MGEGIIGHQFGDIGRQPAADHLEVSEKQQFNLGMTIYAKSAPGEARRITAPHPSGDVEIIKSEAEYWLGPDKRAWCRSADNSRELLVVTVEPQRAGVNRVMEEVMSVGPGGPSYDSFLSFADDKTGEVIDEMSGAHSFPMIDELSDLDESFGGHVLTRGIYKRAMNLLVWCGWHNRVDEPPQTNSSHTPWLLV